MFTYNADGTVTVEILERDASGTLGPKSVVLRRPSIIEYRGLRESVQKLAAIHDAFVDNARAENEAYRLELSERPEEFDAGEWAAKEEHARDNLRGVTDSGDDLRLEWFREIWRTLTGAEIDLEGIPSAVVGAGWPAEIQEHWRARPTVRGGP